jgi:hypothetical protein
MNPNYLSAYSSQAARPLFPCPSRPHSCGRLTAAVSSGPRPALSKRDAPAINLSVCPALTGAARAVKTERLPPYGLPPIPEGCQRAFVRSLPRSVADRQRGCQPGDLTARKDTS